MNRCIKKPITHFIQGLLALLPLFVSGYVVFVTFSFVEGVADKIMVWMPDIVSDIAILRIAIECIAIAVIFLTIMFFGMIVRTMLGKKILEWIDGLFARVPGLNRIYDATKQVAEIFRSGKKQFFTEPVLVQYPSPGIWAVAFNTGEVGGVFKNEDGAKSYTVFIPTTPNPTSGFLAIMKQEQIRKLDIPVEDAIKLILTGGMVKTNFENGNGSEKKMEYTV